MRTIPQKFRKSETLKTVDGLIGELKGKLEREDDFVANFADLSYS